MTIHLIAGVSAALKSFGSTTFINTNKFIGNSLQPVIFALAQNHF